MRKDEKRIFTALLKSASRRSVVIVPFVVKRATVVVLVVSPLIGAIIVLESAVVGRRHLCITSSVVIVATVSIVGKAISWPIAVVSIPVAVGWLIGRLWMVASRPCGRMSSLVSIVMRRFIVSWRAMGFASDKTRLWLAVSVISFRVKQSAPSVLNCLPARIIPVVVVVAVRHVVEPLSVVCRQNELNQATLETSYIKTKKSRTRDGLSCQYLFGKTRFGI